MERSTSKSFDLVSFSKESLMFLLACLLKPISSIKNKINEYADVKTAGVLVILVALCEMVISLISAMISVVFVRQVNFMKGTTSLKVSFEGLKNLDYFQLIIKDFVTIVIIVAAVAGIYYIATCVMKKSTNYFKLASITAISFVPVFVAGLVSTIFAYIYAPISVFVMFAALIYSTITFITCINDEIKLDDKNTMIYFQTICLTVIFIVAYYVLSSDISSVLSFGSIF